MTGAVEFFAPLLDDVAGIIDAATDADTARQAIAEWADTVATSSELQRLLWAPMAQADMGGRLFVWGVEIARDARRKLAEGDRVRSIFNTPFTEALEMAQERGLVNEEALADLLNTYQQRGEEATRAALRTLQDRTARRLQDAIESGETMREFAARVREDSASLGFERRDPAYLENVFRSSTQAAYGAGRHQAITDAADMGAVDYVQRRAIGDSRTRRSHLALDSKTWRADDPEWKRFAPPLLDGRFQYMCRCTHVSLFDGDDLGDTDTPAMELVRRADPDFRVDAKAAVFADPVEAMRAPIT